MKSFTCSLVWLLPKLYLLIQSFWKKSIAYFLRRWSGSGGHHYLSGGGGFRFLLVVESAMRGRRKMKAVLSSDKTVFKKREKRGRYEQTDTFPLKITLVVLFVWRKSNFPYFSCSSPLPLLIFSFSPLTTTLDYLLPFSFWRTSCDDIILQLAWHNMYARRKKLLHLMF